jgi:WD repeat-containing protein 26
MMCSSAEDLLQRADWDGARGTSRRRLLIDLQSENFLAKKIQFRVSIRSVSEYIPSATMIPARRFKTLIDQACAYQRISCVYHNSPGKLTLYGDHECSRLDFPTITTNILEGHEDEVWHLQWSHDGRHLATASKDRTAIIWKIGVFLLLFLVVCRC